MSTIDDVQCPITTASEPVLLESDTELLHSFVAERSDSAFDELIRRHGPMVMGVCRRVLPRCHDAEDAYQATFLLLVKKSAAIRRPERLANWLFGVAYRVATRIRAKASRQESLLTQSLEASTEDNTVEAAWRELQSALDEELQRLPEPYRLPLILCYLEGKTHVEAARALGCPSGSMSSRLTRAREKLRRRLVRRGLTFASALFGMLLREHACGGEVSPALVQRTTRAARVWASGKPLPADIISEPVVELLAEMNKGWLLAKTRAVAVLVLLVLMLLGSAGNAVRVVQSEMKARAGRPGETIPPPFAWIARSGWPAVYSMTRQRSTNRALTVVRTTSTSAAPNAGVPACGQQ